MFHWSPIQPGVMQVLSAVLAPDVAGSESLELVTTRAITRLTLTENIGVTKCVILSYYLTNAQYKVMKS